MRILQMKPGLINDATTNDPESPLTMSAAALQAKSPCGLGSVCIGFYAMTFLTPGERHGMLFWEADRLDKLGLSFEEILATEWPLFGLLARLAEEVILSGSARPVDATCHGAASPSSEATQRLVVALREEVAQRVAQRRPVPEALARRILAAVERVGERAAPGCAVAVATAWAAMAEAARGRADVAATAAYIQRAESALRAMSSNYTVMDWLSTQWPLFRLLHRMHQSLLPSDAMDEGDGKWLQPDLVPYDPQSGQPMRFVFNHKFYRADPLYIDIASDIIRTDLLRTLPAIFGISPARPVEKWNLNLVYTSNDYGDLQPGRELWRLHAGSQRLLFVPQAQEILGEKDQQCRAFHGALDRWQVGDSLAEKIGGMPRCFDMPSATEELRAFAKARRAGKASDSGDQLRMAFVRKPEGMWGGRGIEIRFGIDDLLDEAGKAASDVDVQPDGCVFVTLEDSQCLGLHEPPSPEASASEDACRQACCDMGPRLCEAWNWRAEEGCWVGTPRACTGRNPMFLGGWRGGHRPRQGEKAGEAEQRAVVQQYILDPVLYQLEGVKPPLRVKTDIRIYGTVISMDPFRLYISKRGYFRSGYLERNYSTASDEELKDRLMHVTHHIPKIETGSYQCPTAPSQGHPKGAEHDAGSGGSLKKWFKIAKEQNGLDPKLVWKNIKLAIAVFILGAREQLACGGNAVPHACGSVAFHRVCPNHVIQSTDQSKQQQQQQPNNKQFTTNSALERA
ncbi:unnamed protein product [Polarella glacialis]|uniref:Uncharacterized protein n=2 Tax=Polarella glacialis TaxID=89957 RepID=A0A813L1L9_POLGL|nr:unnamed protein product [Polarella glacialis]